MCEKKAPRCRYCGSEMIFDNHYGDCYYYCPDCKSASPVALTKEEAYQRAILCPPVEGIDHER